MLYRGDRLFVQQVHTVRRIETWIVLDGLTDRRRTKKLKLDERPVNHCRSIGSCFCSWGHCHDQHCVGSSCELQVAQAPNYEQEVPMSSQKKKRPKRKTEDSLIVFRRLWSNSKGS